MEQNEKAIYEAPTMLVVEVKAEGIVCTSEQEGMGTGFLWN